MARNALRSLQKYEVISLLQILKPAHNSTTVPSELQYESQVIKMSFHRYVTGFVERSVCYLAFVTYHWFEETFANILSK